MKKTHSQQGVYAPLPQSLSDSESEKEISMEPITSNNNPPKTFDLRNGHSVQENDKVKIKRGLSKMTPLRKAAFVFSIFMCFLPIVLFLWVLPCSEFVTCPVKVGNWEYQQDSIELKGPINLVKGLYKANLNLALLFKGSHNSKEDLKYGIMSFMGNSGNVAWEFQQKFEPTAINCSIVDVDNNGNFECLVVDKKGLKAIETISGQALWHVRSADDETLIEGLEMPVAIQDLNNDGVFELVSIYNKEIFLIICGKSGKALNKVKPPSKPPIHCDIISDLKLVNKDIEYSCKNKANELLTTQFIIPVESFIKFYKNSSFQLTATSILNNSTNVYTIGKRKLVVNNSMECPHCSSSITLYNDNKLVKIWPYTNAFIMTPVSFSFKPTKENLAALRGHINGFIVKIWEWKDHYKKVKPSTVFKRSIPNLRNNDTVFISAVVEQVVLITFNDTDEHVINASLSDIKQVCFTKDESNCQPDHRNQKDSYLVADLDWDGCHELISYYSTYVYRNYRWQLVSYLKMFRLEEELPKLYGAK